MARSAGDAQQQLASTAAAYEPATPYDARSRLVLLGDSITESWLGTAMGEKIFRAGRVPNVLADKFKAFDPLVLAVSGDQTYDAARDSLGARRGTVFIFASPTRVEGTFPLGARRGILL